MLAKSLILMVVLSAIGCSGLPKAECDLEVTLQQSLIEICRPANNVGRMRALELQLEERGIEYTALPIHALTAQKNIFVNNGGRVLYVAHYDAIDAVQAPFRMLTYGVVAHDFAPNMSDGALDNGCSVAVGIELAKRGHSVLFTGCEEVGLLGAHRFATDGPRFARVVALDGAGAGKTAVSGSPLLVALGRSAGAEVAGTLFPFFATDADAFSRSWLALRVHGVLGNGPIGLLPKRCWLRRGWDAEVALVGGIGQVTWLDALFANLFLPFGRLHGLRDRVEAVNPAHMAEALRIAELLQ